MRRLSAGSSNRLIVVCLSGADMTGPGHVALGNVMRRVRLSLRGKRRHEVLNSVLVHRNCMREDRCGRCKFIYTDGTDCVIGGSFPTLHGGSIPGTMRATACALSLTAVRSFLGRVWRVRLMRFERNLLRRFGFTFSTSGAASGRRFVGCMSRTLVRTRILRSTVRCLPFRKVKGNGQGVRVRNCSCGRLSSCLSLCVIPRVACNPMRALVTARTGGIFSHTRTFVRRTRCVGGGSRRDRPTCKLTVSVLGGCTSIHGCYVCVLASVDVDADGGLRVLSDDSIGNVPIRCRV